MVAAQVEVDALIHSSADEKEQADTAYALRQIEDLADEIRKNCKKQGELAQRMACMIVGTAGGSTIIRTDHVSATCDIRPIVSIPRRSTHPEEFAELMRYLKVPDELWKPGDHAAMQPHWPGLVDLLSRRQAAGLPLPPGIDPNKTWPKYALILRGKKPPSVDTIVPSTQRVINEGTPF